MEDYWITKCIICDKKLFYYARITCSNECHDFLKDILKIEREYKLPMIRCFNLRPRIKILKFIKQLHLKIMDTHEHTIYSKRKNYYIMVDFINHDNVSLFEKQFPRVVLDFQPQIQSYDYLELLPCWGCKWFKMSDWNIWHCKNERKEFVKGVCKNYEDSKRFCK